MYLRLIGSIFLVLMLAGPGLANPISIKILAATHNTSENRAIGYLIKLLEERSGGRIQIEQLPAAENRDGLESLQSQQLQLVLLDSASLHQRLPLLQLFELPFLFTDREHLHKVLDSDLGQQILGAVNEQGMKPLAYWDKSLLQLAASRPLLLPQQARGLYFHDQQSLLAEAFPGAMSDHSLKEQVFELSLPDLAAGRPDASITDLTLSNHAATGDLLLTSQNFWDSLPDDLKVIVLGAISDTTVYIRELMVQTERQALQKEEENGRFRLHQLTSEQRSAWQDAMIRIYRQQLSEKELHFIELILRT